MFENSLYPLYYIQRERRQGGVVGTQAKINNKESRRLKKKILPFRNKEFR